MSSPSPHSARTLALSLSLRGKGPPLTLAEILSEILLKFSPRISFRHCRITSPKTSPKTSSDTWFFLDLSSHQSWIDHHFKTERHLLEATAGCIQELGYSNHKVRCAIRCAIADTPQAAQALAAAHGFWISSPGRTPDDLGKLPLSSLLELEGLEAWPQPKKTEEIVRFFSLLGFHRLGDLNAFTASAFRERWGAIGDCAHRRLSGVAMADPQPIAPYLPKVPLTEFVSFDDSISIVSLLSYEIKNVLQRLFARLEGRRLVARRLHVQLHCEFSQHVHSFTIEPSVPNRDHTFFMTLLEHRLDRIELLNPIESVEFEVFSSPETEIQNGFLDQQVADQHKLAVLTSLLAQEGITAGFAVLKDEVWPELAWRLSTNSGDNKPLPPLHFPSGDLDETGYSPLFYYASALISAPRPCLLLSKPQPLHASDIQAFQFLTQRPLERIEHDWWEKSCARDYYVAVDSNGRCFWIYQDPVSRQFFLHGAFD